MWKKNLLIFLLFVGIVSCREEIVPSSASVTGLSRADTARPLRLFHPPFNRFDTNFRVSTRFLAECLYYRRYRDSFRIYWPNIVHVLDSVYKPIALSPFMRSSNPDYWYLTDSIPQRMFIHVDTVNLPKRLTDPFGYFRNITPLQYISGKYGQGPFGRYPYVRDTVMGYYIKFPAIITPNRFYRVEYENPNQSRIEVLELRLNRFQALHQFSERNFYSGVVLGHDPLYNFNIYRDQTGKPIPYFLPWY